MVQNTEGETEGEGPRERGKQERSGHLSAIPSFSLREGRGEKGGWQEEMDTHKGSRVREKDSKPTTQPCVLQWLHIYGVKF